MLTKLRETGQALAELLAGARIDDPIVLAIPRRGAVVGHRIAQRLRAPLDLLLAAKVLVPGKDLALGAVALDGTRVIDRDAVAAHDVGEASLDALFAATRARLGLRLGALREDWPLLDVEGRHVVLVDDAVVSGLTMLAAIESVAARRPADVVVATALCADESARRLAPRVRDWIALDRRPAAEVAARHLSAGNAICPPIADAEVHDLIADARRRARDGVDGDLETDGLA